MKDRGFELLAQELEVSCRAREQTGGLVPGSGAWTCLCGTARQPRMLTKRSGASSSCLSAHGAVFFCCFCSPCSGFRAQLCQFSSHNARAGGRPSPAQSIPVRPHMQCATNTGKVLAAPCLPV